MIDLEHNVKNYNFVILFLFSVSSNTTFLTRTHDHNRMLLNL